MAEKGAKRVKSSGPTERNGDGKGEPTKAETKYSNIREFPKRPQPGGPAAKLKQPRPPLPAQHQPRPGLKGEIEPTPRYQGAPYRPANKLQDKVALITGGASGIGRAVAVLYAREGADVAIVYLQEEQPDAEVTRAALEAVGRHCLLIPGDVTDPEFCGQAVESAVEHFGKLDILVNNDTFQQRQESIEDVSNEQWELTFRINIFGYFYMAKAAVKHMRKGAAIVNTGSITGLRGSQQLLDYSATKGAIHAFTKSLAQNLVDRGIRVNCVAPGQVWTPWDIADRDSPRAGKQGQNVPVERPARPEEIAPAFVFFASEADSSHITGEVLTLLGVETTAA
ncbi:MAG TPA: SDR family oxidoreductase [Terriglobales bacterium]|nr:SDR family oxidoreductase [Terriglobales bacterium]